MPIYLIFIHLGSWEGDIRLWKLDSKLKSFSLVGIIPAPGFVNSLQLISAPAGAFTSASWAVSQGRESSAAKETSSLASKSSTVLLVAAMGQEHRFGRWMKLKGDGVVNGAMVVALHPRTLV
jgi:ribosomal RNA-processing protein 9